MSNGAKCYGEKWSGKIQKGGQGKFFLSVARDGSHGKGKSRDLIRRREPYKYLREGDSWQGKPQSVKVLDENKLG